MIRAAMPVEDHDAPSHTLAFPGSDGARVEQPFTPPPRWQLNRRLGVGGQAEVWLARDRELDDWVAMKIFREDLDDTQRRRMRQEVRLGRSLSHPNLVRTYELIENGGRVAVAMEWVSEGALAALLEAGPLPIGQVIAVADEVLDVLAYLHGRGIVHRDVKPSNLLLDDKGRVRLADLGLVRPLTGASDMTATAMAVGTPGYMSPEQIRGLDPTPAADLYSLGVTLFHLVTGRPPFAGHSSFEVADKHLHESPQDVRALRRDCPPWLARFIARLIEKSPEDRWPNAARAQDALRRKRVLASPRFWRRAALVAAAAVVALGSLGVWARVHRGAPASVRITPGELVATDAHGHELWRRHTPGEGFSAVIGDFLGEGRAQVAIAYSPPFKGHPAGDPDIEVVDSDGQVCARFASFTPLDLPNYFPGVGPTVDRPALYSLELGGRHPVLGWVNHSLPWFPCLIGLWDATTGARPTPLLFNSGYIIDLRAGVLAGRHVLVASGINNRLGYQGIVAILDPHPGRVDGLQAGVSPDLVSHWNDLETFRKSPVIAYVPLGAWRSDATRVTIGKAGLEVHQRGASLQLDAAGNPFGSPLFGQGPEPRRRFWDALASACLKIETGQMTSAAAVAAADRGQAAALAEPPMRLARTLVLSRAMAIAGRHDDAVALLGDELRRDPEESDLSLRLGEQLAMAGRTPEAVEALTEALRPRAEGRRGVDAAFDLLLLATREGDDELYRNVITRVSGAGVAQAPQLIVLFEPVWAFCRGRWASSSYDVRSTDIWLFRADRVLQRWAQLERDGDAAAAERDALALVGNDEVGPLARLLAARAETMAGNSPAAIGQARQALGVLEPSGHVEVEALLWRALAERILADALAASGDRSSAARHYAAAARLAPQCWFGQPPSAFAARHASLRRPLAAVPVTPR